MTGNGDFTTPAFVPGVGFHPDMYGYKGVWPTGRWGIAQRQYSAAYHLASGRALEKKDKREDMAIYPLQINLWDFIAEVHATMIVGEGANSPPQTNYIGEGVWEKSRARRYSQMIKDTWSASDNSMFWTIFYNTQVFGGYGVIVRLTPERHHPLRYEAISPFSFYPIMDSNYNIIEFFIHRRITHSEARWNYGVTIKPDEEVYYTEYWNPERYDVRINGQRAHYKNGDPMVGSNPFEVAPAVYIPHIRKTSEWGDSQILGVKQMVLDFNARIADVSDAVRDGMLARYWGYNLETPRRIYVGRTPIYSFGNSSDSRTQPQINAITGSHAIKEGADYANILWDLILRVNQIPPVALGVDEGSQRSGATLRARFWSLEAHTAVERSFATGALNSLATITVAGMKALGKAPTDGSEMAREQVWRNMLPQDRAELVNEMVQRKAAGLVSARRAIQQFGDAPDVDEELALIASEQEAAVQRQAQMMQQTSPGKERDGGKGSENKTSRQREKGDADD